MAPSLFGNPKDPAPRPELRWACHPKLPPTAPVGPQAAPAVGSGLVGLLPVRTKVGPARCLAGGQPSPEETRVSETMGTRSHFSLSTGRGGAETLRSWRHGAAWGPPSPLRQACQETPGAPTRKSHNRALREASRKGVWMKGSVRERPQAPHTHMQSCARVPTVTQCTGVRRPPSGAPGPPGPHSKPQARPPQGEGRAWLLQGWTADPVPSVLSRGLWEAGRVGVGRGPAPGQSDRASHCAPSARRAPARVCGPWGEEAAGGPASARSRAFPGRVLRPWPSTGHRADLWWACGVGVWALCPHRSAPPEPSPGPLPRAPPLLCGPCPVSTGPGLRAAGWRGLISSWPAGSGRPREQRVDCASFWACSPPGRCPRGAPGVMLAFAAKLLGLSARTASGTSRGPRSPGAGSLSWTQLACHPSPTSCPKPQGGSRAAPCLPRTASCADTCRHQPTACVCPAPAQPSPAPPCPVMPVTPCHPAAHPGLPGI